MNIRYRVTLTTEERSHLAALIQKGKVAARKVKRAQILLAADQGATDETIANTVAVGTSTVYRTKQRFVEEGLERALSEVARSGAPSDGCDPLEVVTEVRSLIGGRIG